jgi:hypothetical protein
MIADEAVPVQGGQTYQISPSTIVRLWKTAHGFREGKGRWGAGLTRRESKGAAWSGPWHYACCGSSFACRFLRAFLSLSLGSSGVRLTSEMAMNATMSAAVLIAVGMCSMSVAFRLRGAFDRPVLMSGKRSV